MKPFKVVIISPSIYSQHLSLLALGKAFERKGCEVVIACNRSLQGSVESQGLSFYALNLTGGDGKEKLPRSDHAFTSKDQVASLISITQSGIVETLEFQARARLDEATLPDGKQIIQEIARLRDVEDPDLWVVEQNSVISRLAMYALKAPYISFCTSHPLTVPMPKGVYGIPSFWPKGMRPAKEKIRVLRKLAKSVHKKVTRRFNQLQRRFDKSLPKTIDALRQTSPKAILFNYPNFGNIDNRYIDTHRIFLGASIMEEALSPVWREKIQKMPKSTPKILISFGTVFSERSDVVENCIKAARAEYPNALIIANAGSGKDTLQHLADDHTLIESCIPQRALIPHVDLVIHHGGVGTFTETLYFAKPMVIIPFAGDQFSVAYDAQYTHLGEVANPATMTLEELQTKIRRALTVTDKWLLEFWSQRIRHAGPDTGISELRLFDKKERYEEKAAICA